MRPREGDDDRDEPEQEPGPSAIVSAQRLFETAFRLHEAGSLSDAERLYREVLAANPNQADALHLLGVVAYQTGRSDVAAGLIERAIAILPRFAPFHTNLGNALTELGRFGEAIEAHRAAIRLQPGNVAAYSNLAHLHNVLGSFDEALAAAETALRFGPGHPEAHYNRGIALTGLARPREAVTAYKRALQLRADYAEAHSNLGAALFDLGLIDQAIDAYDAALRLKPDLADAHRNKAYALLSRGDWGAAWPEYEWRRRVVAAPRSGMGFARPQWAGEDVAGQTVLLHAEQGLGDTIQFCRYASVVSDRGAKVVLEVPQSLKRLLSGIDGVDQLIGEGDPRPAFDVHCPLMSLPGVFRTEPETIPVAGAYLAAVPRLMAAWSERLGPRSRPRIGLVWSGRAEHRYDRYRSLPLARLLASLPPEFDYVSLQQEVRPEDRATLAAHPDVRHFGAELKDFADTAGLVSQMDVVVSVDTSVAHLAGALGKDVRLLLSRVGQDWRWLSEGSSAPWYPTMRLYRQGEDNDWASPLDAVALDLAGLLGSWPPAGVD